MSRKKSMTSAGLSMLDLISNALAAIIILFFILSSAKLPSIPPERVCGTLLIEFTRFDNSTSDSSTLWIKPPDYLKNHDLDINIVTLPQFDINISKLNQRLLELPYYNSCDSSQKKGLKIKVPTLDCYDILDKRGITKHVCIMHDPISTADPRNPSKTFLEDRWQVGLLYVNHDGIESNQYPDSVGVSIKYFRVGQDPQVCDTVFSESRGTSDFKAPTSFIRLYLVIENDKFEFTFDHSDLKNDHSDILN